MVVFWMTYMCNKEWSPYRPWSIGTVLCPCLQHIAVSSASSAPVTSGWVLQHQCRLTIVRTDLTWVFTLSVKHSYKNPIQRELAPELTRINLTLWTLEASNNAKNQDKNSCWLKKTFTQHFGKYGYFFRYFLWSIIYVVCIGQETYHRGHTSDRADKAKCNSAASLQPHPLTLNLNIMSHTEENRQPDFNRKASKQTN